LPVVIITILANNRRGGLQLAQSYRDSLKFIQLTLLKYNLVLTLEEAGRYKEAVNAGFNEYSDGDSAQMKVYLIIYLNVLNY
jgi:hypothetical protein